MSASQTSLGDGHQQFVLWQENPDGVPEQAVVLIGIEQEGKEIILNTHSVRTLTKCLCDLVKAHDEIERIDRERREKREKVNA